MGKFNLSNMVKATQMFAAKNAPAILTGVGITGFVTATVTAVTATPKAVQLLELEREKRREDGESDVITVVDAAKITWKCYIPTITLLVLSTACVIGGNSVSTRRNAALAAAYALSESNFKEYKDKVVEEIGEKKEKAVRHAIAQDHLNANPVQTKEIIMTEKGNTRCFEWISKRYFTSDIEKLRRIENDLNRRMRDEMYISVNDYLYELGLDPVEIGDEMGWNIDRGYIKFDFSSHLDTEENPCLVVGHTVMPNYKYR